MRKGADDSSGSTRSGSEGEEMEGHHMDGDGEGSKLGKVKGFFGRLGRKRDDRNASADDVSNTSVE